MSTNSETIRAIQEIIGRDGFTRDAMVRCFGLILSPGADTLFDGERAIKTLPQVGVTPGGATVSEFLENLFYGYIGAVISVASIPLQEEGGTFTIPVMVTITPNDETSINSRQVIDESTTLVVGTSPNNSFTVNVPDIDSTRNFRGECLINNQGSPITISDVKQAEFVRPFFYGMHTSEITDPGQYYTILTKSIQKQGNKVIPFNGTNRYAHILIPDNWADISKIEDQNGFDVTASFTKTIVNVTSSGLTPGITSSYKKYVTGITTINNANFQMYF